MSLSDKIWELLSVSEDATVPDFMALSREFNVSRDDAASLMNSLLGKDMILAKPIVTKFYVLSPDAQTWLAEGTPEAALLARVRAAGDAGYVPTANDRAGQGPLTRQGVVRAEATVVPPPADAPEGTKPTKVTTIFWTGKELVDDLGDWLRASVDRTLTAADMAQWKGRKVVKEASEKTFELARGPKYSLWHSTAPADFSREMLAAYQAAAAAGSDLPALELRDYNWAANGKPPVRGFLHPLMSMRREIKEIFQEMGFEEMSTRRWVESSFWNFDTLFQGQAHPARDSHDTFFCDTGAAAVPEDVPQDYRDRVQATHENGGDTGSIGYLAPWSVAESQRNILRTHTTAVSAHKLYDIAQEWKAECDAAAAAGRPAPPIPTRRLFSVDRVFRNEKLDATHLAEFHQIEGVVLAPNLTVGHLMQVIREFFVKYGLEGIEFKPTYNPYTEPSMEIFVHHPGLGRTIEVGNCGMFRPEMLRPMGFPPEATVIAWGFGLERPTMIKNDIRHIRKMFGHQVALGESIRRVPICMLQTDEEAQE